MIMIRDDFDLNVRFWHFADGKKYAFTFIALFLLLLIIYANSFHCGWHFDDSQNIVDNVSIHLKKLSWQNIGKILCAGEKLPRPFSYLSFALNYYFGGLDVFGYHLVNLAVHYISAVFLFLFIYNTLKLPILRKPYGKYAYSVALMSTFLWAVNPVQVLAVSYIVQRMASMAGMFYIMSMYFYLKGRTSDSLKGGMFFFILCCVSAALAFGTKENAAMLPVVLFLFDLFLIQGVSREAIKKNAKVVIIPFLILLGLGVFYTDFSSLLDGYDNRPFTLVERLLTEPRVILLYISLLLYPVDYRLMLIHDIQISHTLFTPWATLPAILLILLIAGYALYICRRRPLISFGIFFFFLNHLIEGSVIPLELIYEHRNYIPSMLFFVPVAVLTLNLFDYLSYRKSVQLAVAFGITFLFVVQGHGVYLRNETLRSDFTLWSDNVNKAPNLSRAHVNLGKAYIVRGFRSEAFQELNKALKLNKHSNLSNAAISEHNLGQFYLAEGKDALALASYRKSLAICPEFAAPMFGIARIELKKGNAKTAYTFIIRALRSNPAIAELHEFSGLILLKLGRFEESLAESQKTLELNPEKTIPLIIMAEAFRKKGENSRAIQYWKKFMAKSPQNITAHLALIDLYSLSGENSLLTETVDHLMGIKKGRNLEDVVREGENNKMSAYQPDREKILKIIRKNLLRQVQDTKTEGIPAA
jgi:tetratricopeptide (TPR) repeat protein